MQIDYRKIEALNYSSLKLFDDSPLDYYRMIILKEKKEYNTNTALLIGSVVDFYLIDCNAVEEVFEDKFDTKFALYSGTKSTAQAFYLADILYKITVRDTQDGICTTDFKTRFKEAMKIAQAEGKYKGKTEDKVLDDFNNTALSYYDELIQNADKQVVDIFILDKAKKIVEQLITHNFTYKLFQDKKSIERLNKVVIQFTLEIDGIDISCKSEIDMIHIDHEHKIVRPYDLKTTYDNDNFEYNFVKNKYYLQMAFYYLSIRAWMQKDEKIKDYKLESMKFVVADTSKNNRYPLVYTTDDELLKKGLKGFNYKERYYKGVEQLLSEVAWAFNNNIWKCTKETYENNGTIKLTI